MMPIAALIFCVLCSFAIGSIPWGYFIAKASGVDIRSKGSGNIGATNVWRVLGWKLGLLCFVLDVLKGLGPTLAFGLCSTSVLAGVWTDSTLRVIWLAVGVAAVLGHMFTPWLGFKGGKGVSTSFGALLGVYPVFTIASLLALGAWLISVKLTRMVGISSCIATLVLVGSVLIEWLSPRFGIATNLFPASARATGVEAAFVIALGFIVIFKHRANIQRTIAGTESKIGSRKPRVAPAGDSSSPQGASASEQHS